jgi:DNA-binding PadR family transcriptional regulator
MHDFLHRLGWDRLERWHREHHSHHHHFGRGGRHHGGGRGFGFGPGGDFGVGGVGPGRKLSAADLQLLILVLLAEQPRHGYELIKAFEERSKGYYVPSPGMIYPALAYLEEVGYASVEAEGPKKLYSVTVAGLAHLDENRAAADAMLQQLERIGERMDRLREAYDETGDAARGFFGRHGMSGAMNSELHDAYHALKAALRAKAGAPAAEQRRLAELLRRAARDVAGE